MISYADVRNWRPDPLDDVEQRLTAFSEALRGQVDEVNAATRPGSWHGSAAEAASRTRDQLAGRVGHIVAGVEAVRVSVTAAAVQVRGLALMVAALDESARAQGYTIDGAGRVVDGAPDHNGVNPVVNVLLVFAVFPLAPVAALQRMIVSSQLSSRVEQIIARAEGVDAAVADVFGRVERNEIPAPRPRLPADRGAGEHGSDPWYTRGDDLLSEADFKIARLWGRAIGWTHAADLLKHYLGNSGDDYLVNPDDMTRDMPIFRRGLEATATDHIRTLAQDVVRDGRYGVSLPFRSEWKRADLIDDTDADWFNAIGQVDYSVTGVATVFAPDQPGAPPTVEVDYQNHIFDRYNWDEGKTATFGPLTISLDRLAELHRAGVAKEFNVVGSSEVKRYAGPVP